MQFAVLGPIEVTSDAGHALSLGGPRQRAVLAMLLMEANRPVSKDRLMDGVWGERAPPVPARPWTPTYQGCDGSLGLTAWPDALLVMSCGSDRESST